MKYIKKLIFVRQAIVEIVKEIKSNRKGISGREKNAQIDARMETDITKEEKQ